MAPAGQDARPGSADTNRDQLQALQKCKIWMQLKAGQFEAITKDNVKELYDLLDREDTGEVSTEDLHILRQIPELSLTDEDIEDLVRDCDTDDSGKVSAEELYAAFTTGINFASRRVIEKLRGTNKPTKPNECTRKDLIEWLEYEHNRNESLWSLPQTFVLFLCFCICLTMHINVGTAFQMQDSLSGGVTGEGAPFLYKYVHDIPSFWDWMDTSFIGVHLKNDLLNQPYPGRLESYNQIVGGIQMQKHDVFPGSCGQSDFLARIYASVHGKCHKNGESVKDSEFVLYHERNEVVAEKFKHLRDSTWLSHNTTMLDQRILFYNAYLNAFTNYHLYIYFEPDAGRKDGVTGFKFVQETFLAEPYYTAVKNAQPWLLIPDMVFILILLKMMYGELKEMVPACMNGPDGFLAYWGFWNFVDWSSMIFSFVLVSLWIVVCIDVGGTLQDAIAALPTAALDKVIHENQTYFTREALDAAVDRAEFERRIATLHDVADSIAAQHQNLRYIVAVNALLLMAKFFKAFQANPRLNVVLKTFTAAWTDLWHFAIVFSVIFFVFSMLGMVLFGSKLKTFSTPDRSMMMCWRILMGDDITEDMEIVTTWIAWAWIVLYQTIVGLILLNMIVAIIMDAYMSVNSQGMSIDTQTVEAIKTRAATRGFVDRWQMICDFKDEDERAHPGEHVTVRSLRRAFENYKMTKGNAEYLVQKTQEWVQDQSADGDISMKDAMKIIGQVRTIAMKINSRTESTLEMLRAQAQAPQEARFDLILAGMDPDNPAGGHTDNNGFGTTDSSFGATAGTGFSATGGSGFGALGGPTAPPPPVASKSWPPTAMALDDGQLAGELALPGVPDSPKNAPNGGFDLPTGPNLALTNGSNGCGSNATPNDAILPMDISQHPQQQSMQASQGRPMTTGGMNHMLLKQMQMMTAHIQKLQFTLDDVQERVKASAQAEVERGTWFEKRLSGLERRSERVEKVSDQLKATFHCVDFDEIMNLPKRISDATMAQINRTQADFMADLQKYRTAVGDVAGLLSDQVRRERGLYEIIDNMERQPIPNWGECRRLMDEFFSEQSQAVVSTMGAHAGAPQQAGRNPLRDGGSSDYCRGAPLVERAAAEIAAPVAPLKGTPADNQRRLEARMDALAQQVTALLTHAEEQADARQMLWRIDVGIRQLRNNPANQALANRSSTFPVAENAREDDQDDNGSWNCSRERKQSKLSVLSSRLSRPSSTPIPQTAGSRTPARSAGQAIATSNKPP